MTYEYLLLVAEVLTEFSSYGQISNMLLIYVTNILFVSFGLYYYGFQRASLFLGNISKTES